MRLANEEQSTVRNIILQADADALIYLFGSRVDHTAKGGDIDQGRGKPRPSGRGQERGRHRRPLGG